MPHKLNGCVFEFSFSALLIFSKYTKSGYCLINNLVE